MLHGRRNNRMCAEPSFRSSLSVGIGCLALLLLVGDPCRADEPDDLRTAIECCRERPPTAGLQWGDTRLWAYGQLQWTDPDGGDGSLALRRLKLIFEPRLGRRTTGFVQTLFKTGNDSGTDDRVTLLDAWLRFDLGPGRLQVGQFKPPMGLERFTWDGALELIDRSQATDRLIPNGTFGDSFTRDYGVQWTWSWPKARMTSAVAVFGGRGANTDPDGVAPLWSARTVWKPKLADTQDGLARAFRLGAALSTRDGGERNFSKALPGTASLGYRRFSGRDSRAQVEVVYEHGRWRFAAELFRARFASDTPELPSISADGGYVLVACQPLQHWGFAIRHETFDPNIALDDHHDTTLVTVGATYYLRRNFHKVMVNRVFRDEVVDEADNDTWLVRYQRVF